MSDRRSRGESMSTAPMHVKMAFLADKGKAPAPQELVRGKKTWKPVATASTLGTYVGRRKFDKNAAGLPPPKSLDALP